MKRHSSDISTGKAGDQIGRYRLLEQIGEGGCGVVYLAEQTEPVQREVAVKIIKLGMDTKRVIARFEVERQALAIMDHPNIAKVFDAGVTETGRPYFVMELVRGVKITEYCDQQKLSTRQRLDLFIAVCQAIQHAHQKGVIHRDIKPSNILVTEQDGKAQPKVIDFGIAKAIGGQVLTDKTLFTAFEQFVGTPAYMSPEQAGLRSLDIDTRSDIYSLGVLLYELLTGELPFSGIELGQGAIDEMLRTIRERQPSRPSARLTTLAKQELSEVARRRQATPAELPRLLQGELDWVVMKSLEKDRSRRYDNANGLAEDLERFLDGEPVSARSPSRLYQFQKLVSRNKLAFGAATALAVVLVAATMVSATMFVRLRNARTRQLAVEKARDALDAGAGKLNGLTPMEPSEPQSTNRGPQARTEKMKKQENHARTELQLRRQVLGEQDIRKQAQLRIDLAWFLLGQNKTNEAESFAREAWAKIENISFHENDDVVRQHALTSLYRLLWKLGKLDEAEHYCREWVRDWHDLYPLGRIEPLAALAALLWDEDKLDEARSVYREAQEWTRKYWLVEDRKLRESLRPSQSQFTARVVKTDISEWGDCSFIDSLGDCAFALEDGKATIAIPGTSHCFCNECIEEYKGGVYLNMCMSNSAPQLLKEVEGDFIVQVKVGGEFDPGIKDATGSYVAGASALDKGQYAECMGWLVLMENEQHCLTFGRWAEVDEFREPRLVEHFPRSEYNRNGEFISPPQAFPIQPHLNGAPLWLRATRHQGEIHLSVSRDGKRWIETETVAVEFPDKIKLGVAAVNRSNKPFKVEFSDLELVTGSGLPVNE